MPENKIAKETKQAVGPMVQVPKAEFDALVAKVSSLESQGKMLYEVADKGRVFNYEASRAEKKPTQVKLSVFQEKIIVGWRTVKDTLVKHPTTGRTVGEEQEYEVLLLDKEGNTSKAPLLGYPAFSDARYNERIDAQVVGRKEDYDGKITFDLLIPDGRTISVGAVFAN